MKAFDVKVNGKLLDYRLGKDLNLEEIRNFFSKKYTVKKIWQEKRHVVAILGKDGKQLFLKLAPTEGISAVTQMEFKWNDEFNKLVKRDYSDFWVPINVENGYLNKNFYMITDFFEGEFYAKPKKDLSPKNFIKDINRIIDFSEAISELDINEISYKDLGDYKEWFFEKTKSWYESIPQDVIDEFKIKELLEVVEFGYQSLEKRARHGDFTPWHMFKLKNGKIGLIDGEHAMKNGVEYYDSSYIIQRVFEVMENKKLAKEMYDILVKRFYNEDKLQTVLSARAIGGFLDESFKENPNYPLANEFKEWVLRY